MIVIIVASYIPIADENLIRGTYNETIVSERYAYY